MDRWIERSVGLATDGLNIGLFVCFFLSLQAPSEARQQASPGEETVRKARVCHWKRVARTAGISCKVITRRRGVGEDIVNGHVEHGDRSCHKYKERGLSLQVVW